MMDLIREPWPWYVAGPLIGLMVPLLLIFGNKNFGISSSLRHICAMCAPMNIKYFKYEWKNELWNVYYVAGVIVGGIITNVFLMGSHKVEISEQTVLDLQSIGVTDFSGYLPTDIFSWQTVFTLRGVIFIALGGLLVGFGTRYANGCTSGHSISGLSNFQFGSLVATISFFVGGLVMTHFVLPYLI